jgi:spore coat polysaccharide biosynthesis protein SpsF
MGSTRLPGKALLPLAGQPALERVIKRVRAAKKVDTVIVATTENKEDRAIVRLCRELDVLCFTGDENNVLKRITDAVSSFIPNNDSDRVHRSPDVVIDITADCPLVDPRHIDKIIQALYDDETADYASNCLELKKFKREWPDGLDIQAARYGALLRLADNEKYQTQTAHTLWNMTQKPKVFKCIQALPVTDEKYRHPEWGLTLDTKQDLILLDFLFKRMHKIYQFKLSKPGLFPVESALDYIDDNQHLLEINKDIERKTPGDG